MSFDPSVLKVLVDRPWRWTTPPNQDGTGGVQSAPLPGVFVLIDDSLIDELASLLNSGDASEIRSWIYRVTEAQAAEWHIPLWSGQSSGVLLRIPAAIWNDPQSAPPPKVKRFFSRLYKASQG